MGLDKVLALVSDWWSKYWPALLTTFVLLMLLRVWALDPLAESELVSALTNAWDTSVNELGAVLDTKVPRVYPVVVVAYLYLTIAQQLGAWISGLKLFEVTFSEPMLRPSDAFTIIRILPTVPPKAFEALRATRKVVSEYIQSSSGLQPFLNLPITRWRRFYGIFLVAFLGTVAWVCSGAPGAQSHRRAVAFLAATAVFSLFARSRLKRALIVKERTIRSVALHDLERRLSAREQLGQVDYFKSDELEEDIRYELALERHPTKIASRLAYRLLPNDAARKVARLLVVTRNGDADGVWATLSSFLASPSQEGPVPPSALSTALYTSQFRGLLECSGAGLFILVDSSLGVAPSVRGGGCSYSFASRSHDGYMLKLTYWSGLESGKPQLIVDNFEARWGFLASVGPHPIELIAQHSFPATVDNWHRIIDPALDTSAFECGMFRKEGVVLHGIKVSDNADLELGFSYILRCQIWRGSEAVIALQCFRIGETRRILVAYKILSVRRDPQGRAKPLPWWMLQSWTEAITDVRTHFGKA